ncbi:type III secretion system export apparatus subunit SctT [Collimonas sp.]|jgi:type III secretion protein T|uniref:type III secretion system export apparatus subunit SctT n=1 Tax=Collimonas sp. TaxID=1963772 RepID=UPI002B9E4831|nr:type III secretion system export apparatus subunit SctT [Collimonas sp.]HWW07899.1 type III secretion system export apparatus subunit SctT [Collimonas sp.]
MNELTTLSNTLLSLYTAYHNLIVMMLLAGMRIMIVFLVFPPTSDQAIPGIARNGVIYLLTYFVTAGQNPETFENLNSATLLVLTAKEAFLGLAFGYSAATAFWIAQSVGTLIDDLAGFNNIQMSNPLRGDQSTPVSAVLLQLVVTLFYVGGGMIFVLGALFESFKWWPVEQLMPSLSSTAEAFLIQRTDSIWTGIAKLGTPIMLVLVLIEIGIGLISRAADKLEPNSLSQPLRGAVGLVMVIALAAVFAGQVVNDIKFLGFGRALSAGMVGNPQDKTAPENALKK